jgi:hypothetical protein
MKAPIIISIVLAAFGLFTGVYLVGSFCEASFDIREWNGGVHVVYRPHRGCRLSNNSGRLPRTALSRQTAMTDDLHKYPGNLRHHEVKKLPLYTDAALDMPEVFGVREIRDTYEEVRQQQARLIQTLVNTLQQVADEGTWTPEMHEALREAEQHGFKPQ